MVGFAAPFGSISTVRNNRGDFSVINRVSRVRGYYCESTQFTRENDDYDR